MINSFIKPEFNSRHFHLYEKKILDLIKTGSLLSTLSQYQNTEQLCLFILSANFTEFTLLCDQTLTSLSESVRRQQRPARH